MKDRLLDSIKFSVFVNPPKKEEVSILILN